MIWKEVGKPLLGFKNETSLRNVNEKKSPKESNLSKLSKLNQRKGKGCKVVNDINEEQKQKQNKTRDSTCGFD